MKVYQVIHLYDVDGGFGDAIPEKEVVATFSKEKDADDFIEKYAKPHIYDKPYACLSCGELTKEEIEVDEDVSEIYMWWLKR